MWPAGGKVGGGRWEEGLQHFGDTTPTQAKAGFQIRTTSSSHARHTPHLTTVHRPPSTTSFFLSLKLLTISSSVQIPPPSLDLIQPSPRTTVLHHVLPPDPPPATAQQRPPWGYQSCDSGQSQPDVFPLLKKKQTANATNGSLTMSLSTGWRRISRHSLPTPLPRCPQGSST